MLERLIERTLFASRWLLVPLYLGLSLLLVGFVITFFFEMVHIAPRFLALAETDIVLAALGLVDLVLVANLIVMVIFTGYENFVSRLDVAQEKAEQLGWLGKIDAGTLKIKLAASIVAISSIHLLKAFMNVQNVSNDKLLWMVIVHLTFVVSALLLGYLDKIAFAHHREH